MDHLFWLAVLIVFVLGIASALMKLREKDKCLKLLDDQRVSYLGGRTSTLWGRLAVVNKGLQLGFDQPFVDRAGKTKSSALIYESEYTASVALCRTATGPNAERESERQLQVQTTFDPGRKQRYLRATRNLLYTIRDAVAQALGAVTGQVSRSGSFGRTVAAPTAGVATNANSVVEFIGNAYEELLERQIGKPVVLELDPPLGSGTQSIELAGYLVDYTERFLAVFNVEHTVIESHTLEFEGSRDDLGIRAAFDRGSLELTSRSDLPLILNRITLEGEATDLSVVLLKGCSLRISANADAKVKLEFDTTETIDIVCPRATSRIRFGGASEEKAETPQGWNGVAPSASSEPPR